MSESDAIFVASCRKHIGGFCIALSALTMPYPSLAAAAAVDPELRRSERLDIRRLGKVSEDERSVLRIEWRAGLTGAEEARGVQELLDNLRRIEQTVAAISLLVRNLPAPMPVVETAAAGPEASLAFDIRLLVANIAAACLVALWWFRRRQSAKSSGAAAPPVPAEPHTMPATGAAAVESPPASEPPVIDFSLEVAGSESSRRADINRPGQAAAPPGTASRQPEDAVEPTLQLAEIMLSMGLEQGAAQALVDYAEANPRDALYHWLKLLGIYRQQGLHKDFAETAEKLRHYFNIHAEYSASQDASQDANDPPTLEKFSRVAEHVQEIWRQPDQCIGYLRHLLEDNREGVRAGFPQTVAEEILLLIEILKTDPTAAQTTAT